ncbi:hypothetical protein M514_08277, partial [Trichuris suis]
MEISKCLKELDTSGEGKEMCVISVLGKKDIHEHWTIAGVINDAFGVDLFEQESWKRETTKGCRIDMAVDLRMSLVVLHLIGPYDLSEFEFSPDKNFQSNWPALEREYMLSLFFLLSLSHLVLFICPTAEFDTNYVKKFRNMQWLRERLSTSIADIIRNNAPNMKKWRSNARLASPRVLFCLMRPPTFLRPDGTVEAKRSTYRRMEGCLENLIHDILQSSEVIKVPLSNSIISLPEKEAFVYVMPPDEQPKNIAAVLVTQMISDGNPDPTFCCADNRSDSHDAEVPFNTLGTFLGNHISAVLCNKSPKDAGLFPNFVFERPNLEAFVKVATVLHNYLIVDYENNDEIGNFFSYLDIDTALSKKLCSYALSLAEEIYLKELPPFYLRVEHESRLLQATQFLSYEARGCLVEEALAKLKSSCEEVWRNGRQQCEAVSMCGNPCSLQLHRAPGEEEDNSLPVLAHDSKVAFLGTCNGGHSQSIRHDPFDLRTANYSFYEENPDFTCCRFSNRSQDYKSGRPFAAASFEEENESLNVSGSQERPASALSNRSASESEEEKEVVQPTVSPSEGDKVQESDQPNVTTPIESVISAICRSSSSEGSESENDDDINGKPLGDVAGEKLDDSAFLGINLGNFENEQPGENEEEVKTYVGVPNNTIQHGMQPEFPSYAIVCVGSSSKYTHSRGLRDQPNFSHGSQYLLRWDVDVSVDGDKWQEWQIKTGTFYARGAPLKKSFHKKRGVECIARVKVFVGYEYECMRGHRFMLRSPVSMLKHSGVGGPKEKAENIVQEDMPLWFPCSCRGTKPFLLGLLTRIHVVTPKAPVHVCVNPRIQPDTTQDLVFMIGLHKLGPSKYWIVRLPFIYHNPGGPTFWKGEGDAPEGLVFKHMLQVDPDFPPQSKDESISS